MTQAGAGPYELTLEEQEAFERDGYVVRHDVFAPAEIAGMVEQCEALVADLVRDRDGQRHQGRELRLRSRSAAGRDHQVGGRQRRRARHRAVRPPLANRWASSGSDHRLVEPMRAMIGCTDVTLFTEKLNLKRPRQGGPNPPHQDYPYWRDSAQDPTQVATTIVYLDDSSVENGCTWVVPGSHRSGMWQTRSDIDVFGGNELDQSAYPDVEMVPVEVAAGSTVSFGPFLVHQSRPNTLRPRPAGAAVQLPASRPTHLFAQLLRRPG